MKIYKKIFSLLLVTFISCSVSTNGWAMDVRATEDYNSMKDYEYQLKYGTNDFLLAPETKELRNYFQKNMEESRSKTTLSIETFDIPSTINDLDIIQDIVKADDMLNIKDLLDLYAEQKTDGTRATDNRVRVDGVQPPFNGICLLQLEFKTEVFYATGFLVNGTHVITSAHCVQDPELGNVQNIGVIPGGVDLNSIVSGQYAVSAVVPSEWLNGYEVGVDIAVLGLAKSYSSLYSYSYQNESPTAIANGTYFICGFPGDKSLGTMWADFSGKVEGVDVNANYIALSGYTIVGGNSGGPLINYNPIKSIGIISRVNPYYSYVTKINADLAYFIVMNT